tara:strand:- start:635 stop:1060 length:426 start_codon:yes stop_codon:yes gene_type:complete
MFNNSSRYKHTNNLISENYTNINSNNNSQSEFNPFDKNYWGPKTWDILHSFSYSYPDKPTQQQKLNAFNFYSSIGYLLPCSYCQEHCLDYINKFPPQVDSKNNLVNWVLTFHNEVNINLGKETWSRIRLDNKYNTDNAFCS